jgi:hypothetical protein
VFSPSFPNVVAHRNKLLLILPLHHTPLYTILPPVHYLTNILLLQPKILKFKDTIKIGVVLGHLKKSGVVVRM